MQFFAQAGSVELPRAAGGLAQREAVLAPTSALRQGTNLTAPQMQQWGCLLAPGRSNRLRSPKRRNSVALYQGMTLVVPQDQQN